jgi:hypothetical protein
VIATWTGTRKQPRFFRHQLPSFSCIRSSAFPALDAAAGLLRFRQQIDSGRPEEIAFLAVV